MFQKYLLDLMNLLHLLTSSSQGADQEEKAEKEQEEKAEKEQEEKAEKE